MSLLSPEELERLGRMYSEVKQHFIEKYQRADKFFEEERRAEQGDIEQRAKEFLETERRQTKEYFKQKFGWDDF